jgi:PadR family transcriptional regulator, regulatory protein PadR
MTGLHDAQLLKGVLRLLLLELLAQGESYGYELVLRLREHGLDSAGEGSVYPALSRLEREGLLVSKLEASRRGAARKYYRLTPAGESALADARAAWAALRETVDRVSEPRKGERSDASA